jgi:hypothetical protein
LTKFDTVDIYNSMNSIFVQIASYRDTELIPTIEDCISKAKFPENLVFGIAWQHSNEQNLSKYKEDKRFKILDIPYKESKGASWARSQINSLYSDEKYTLQIDSHTRFIQNWDEELISMWESMNDPYAVLTTYPSDYYPNLPEEKWVKTPYVIHTHSILDGKTQQRPRVLPNWEDIKSPIRAIHLAAGFVFSIGQMIKDVPYDPNLYFIGEEMNLSIRLYTHGYNLYHPHKIIIWHYYIRKGNPKHWDDHSDWGNNSLQADIRNDCLLKRKFDINLGIYNLGNKRTLEEYQNYSGIDYTRNILHLDTIDGKEPPRDLSDFSKWSYEIKEHRETIKWNYNIIDKTKPYRFWAFIFKDQTNNEIYRQDVLYSEDKDLLDGIKREKEFVFNYYSPAQKPSVLIIWPYAESMEWLNKTIINL